MMDEQEKLETTANTQFATVGASTVSIWCTETDRQVHKSRLEHVTPGTHLPAPVYFQVPFL